MALTVALTGSESHGIFNILPLSAYPGSVTGCDPDTFAAGGRTLTSTGTLKV
ncbi:MAG TPA: hypothetical protein VFG77_03190 [Nitrososphaeraceae archaeon]|nr:hypothetical protein [Nitrososphaeraceae archaeon]